MIPRAIIPGVLALSGASESISSSSMVFSLCGSIQLAIDSFHPVKRQHQEEMTTKQLHLITISTDTEDYNALYM